MYAVKKDAKATVNEVLLMAGHIKDLLDDDTLSPQQIGEAHDALITAVKAMEAARAVLTT